MNKNAIIQFRVSRSDYRHMNKKQASQPQRHVTSREGPANWHALTPEVGMLN